MENIKGQSSPHFDIRLAAYGIPCTIVRNTVYGAYVSTARTKKTLEIHKKLAGLYDDNEKPCYIDRKLMFEEHPRTTLITCDVCGKTSTPKKVQERTDCWGWNIANPNKDHVTPSKHTLCMGCWNKVRPLVRKAELYRETKSLINKLNKEQRQWRKSNQAAT